MDKTILHVCGYAAPYPGNFIASLVALAKSNKELGYETVFAFPITAMEKEWCRELEEEYKIYYLPLKKARMKLKTYLEIKKIYSRHNIVVAHSHFELYDMPVNLMAEKRTKVFWHLHDALDLIYAKSSFIYKMLWEIQYRLASKNVTLLSVSEKGKKIAIKLGFDEKKAYFLPNAIETKRIDNVDEKSNMKYDFLMYGWDFRRKGVDILIDAINDKVSTKNYSCALVADEKVWERIGNVNHLIHQPSVKNVSSLYSSSRCFLHISRQEGLSYALLEAIYSGCIVICSDIEQNLFAKEFSTVIFVEVGNSTDLAMKMDKLLSGEISITNEMINQSKNIILKKYSIENWVQKIQEFYFGQ